MLVKRHLQLQQVEVRHLIHLNGLFGNYQSSGTTFNPTENGEYTLVATDANDCEGRLMRVYNTVGVSEFEDLEVLVYPNPVKESLIVEVTKQSNLDEDYIIKF